MPRELHEYTQLIMGVQARILVYARDRAASAEAAGAAFARMSELESVMSDYRSDSEIVRLSREAGGVPFEVSQDLYNVLDQALAFSEASGGAFDPTVGPLVALWRTARRDGRLPQETEREQTARLVDWRLLSLDPDRRSVKLAQAGMRLDLGGIGKGYACDRALEVLRARGFKCGLVELGGDMALGAAPPGMEGWRVAVQPRQRGAEDLIMRLRNCGVATSGSIEQFLEIGGRRYSHILDPRTGAFLPDHGVVTVVASDATTADALASAVSVLGPEEGRRLAARYPGTRVVIE